LKTQSEELKEANEELSESEKRFRTLAENSPDVIIRLDRQKRHIYANPAVEGPYGRSPDEVIGKTQSELGRYSGQLKFLEKHYENVFATGKPETVEFQYISAQGNKYYLNTKIVPEFINDRVTSILAVSRDIKDIKEAEAKLKDTLDNLENLVKERTSELEKAYSSLKESERRLAEAQKMAHLGNWYWNLKTDKVYWSDEVYRIFGFKPQEFEVTYNAFLSHVHPEDRRYIDNNFKKALNGESYGSDYRIILANGIERIVHTQSEIVFDEKKTPIGMRGTIQDITERKRAEEALEKIEKIRIKEIHHRIKNNLQVICSLLSLEADRFTDEKMLEALRESQNRVTSMALIHEELYKGGKNDSVDFAAYLQKLTADLFSSYSLGNDNINLKMDLDQVYLEMDTAIPLGIIVNELVSNSLKHAFPAGGKGEININLCKNENFAVKCNVSGPGPDCMEKNGFYYVLTVTDNGEGIPEEIEFQNADSLGLQLINILVEQIDGCIELKRNNGTKFTIWFSNIE
jgi:PAS domain S-box-containing protein